MAVRELTDSERVRNYEIEAEWRALPESEQPFLVCFMGLMGYGILAVCDTEEEAEEVLACYVLCTTLPRLASPRRYMRQPGWTREASPHDYQVRQQFDLDALTRAILGSYR